MFYDDFQEIFNTREQALIIWLLVILAASIASKKVRPSLYSLFKVFFVRRIVLVMLACWLYVAAIVFLVEKIGWWNQSMLKDLIIWMLTIIVMLVKVASKGKSGNSLLEIFKNAVQPMILVEFLVNMKPFAVGWELVILPGIALIYAMSLVGSENPEHKIAVNFLNTLLAIWGLFIVGNSIYKVMTNFNDINTHQEGLNFFMPLWLTVAIIPCLYGVMLYSRYEVNRARDRFKNH